MNRDPPSTDRSSLLERMIEALGGPDAVQSADGRVVVVHPVSAETLTEGRCLLDGRYEIASSPDASPPAQFLPAFDRATRQRVALTFVAPRQSAGGVDGELREEITLAMSVSHPNVCRVHDVITSPWGPAVVMEAIDAGRSLEEEVLAHRGRGLTADRFRQIAADAFAGLAAIHARELVHGSLTPRQVLVAARRAALVCVGLTPVSRRTGGGVLGASSTADDVRALAAALSSTWTHEPGLDAQSVRSSKLKDRARSDLPNRLAPDELKQIFRALHHDRTMRPSAHAVRFHARGDHTPSAAIVQRAVLHPGPLPQTGAHTAFCPDAQALLVTYAGTAPELVGRLLPLRRPSMTVGRSPSADSVLPESTVSGIHARVTWKACSWQLDDLGSTNGSYGDVGYDRQPRLVLRHGREVQLGEARLTLVSFAAGSPGHRRARSYLDERDGVSGLYVGEPFRRALDEEGAFADWADLPMHVAVYELHADAPPSGDRLSMVHVLATHRVARRIVQLTEAALVSLCPVVAGLAEGRLDKRPGLAFSIVGPGRQQAEHLVEAVAAQARAILPPVLTLDVRLVERPHGRRASRAV